MLDDTNAAAGESAAMAPAQLLQLADTLARRQAGGSGGYSAEALLLHVEVLRQQRRFSDAADLAADSGAKVIPLPADQRSLHAALLVKDRRGNFTRLGI